MKHANTAISLVIVLFISSRPAFGQSDPPEDTFAENMSVGAFLETPTLRDFKEYFALYLLVPLDGKTELRLSGGFDNQSISGANLPWSEKDRDFLFTVWRPHDAIIHTSVAIVRQFPAGEAIAFHAGVSGACWWLIPDCSAVGEAVSRMSFSQGLFRAGTVLGVGWYVHPRLRLSLEYHVTMSISRSFGSGSWIGNEHSTFLGYSLSHPVALGLAFKPF
ncbi:MAG: hypothetical protein C0600_02970 [Ignavibacteria bacterium]|nr:MAG: hypothetical protein C0600_02970 [Ignavibacteria bacterium]